MRNLSINEISHISGGTDANTSLNTIEYGDHTVKAQVVVPASTRGQVVYLNLQVVEDTLLHKIF
jgi:hypothetical protein